MKKKIKKLTKLCLKYGMRWEYNNFHSHEMSLYRYETDNLLLEHIHSVEKQTSFKECINNILKYIECKYVNEFSPRKFKGLKSVVDRCDIGASGIVYSMFIWEKDKIYFEADPREFNDKSGKALINNFNLTLYVDDLIKDGLIIEI